MSALLTLEFQSSRERDSAVNHYSVCGYQHVWSYAPTLEMFPILHRPPLNTPLQHSAKQICQCKYVHGDFSPHDGGNKVNSRENTSKVNVPLACRPVLPTRAEATWIFLGLWAYGTTCLTKATWGPALALCVSWPLGSGAVNRWYTTLWRQFGNLYGGGSCEFRKDWSCSSAQW